MRTQFSPDGETQMPSLLRQPQRWVWTCVGAYVALSVSGMLLVWAMLPQFSGQPVLWKAAGLVSASAAALYVALGRTARRVHRHAEQGAASEDRLRHLLRSLEGAAWFASPDGTLLHYISPRFEQLYGRAPDAQAGMPGRWHELIHADDRQAVAAALAGLEQAGSITVQYRIVRPDGSLRWVDDWTHVIRAQDGQVIGLGGTMQDITDRREHQRALAQTRQRLDAVVESAMDAILAVDTSQRVVLFNAAAGRLLGVAAADAIGQPLDRFIPQAVRSSHAQQVARFARDGATRRSMGHLASVTALHADGSEIQVEAAISRSGEGEHTLLTVVLRDARPQRAAEQAQLAQAQAEAANLAKSKFLSRMSHELRTPLNAVLGFAQLMQSDTRTPLRGDQTVRIKNIEQAGWHLLALINETLDLSRIEAGYLNLKPAPVDVDAVVVEARALCETLAHKHQVTVLQDSSNEPAARAWVDMLRLRQVVLNLLSNAIKYNRTGGRVKLSVVAEAQTLVLCVQDTGAGMTEQQVAHLFEPFNRLGRDRTGVDGTGIGLVVTRSLVEAMKGSIQVTSQPGEGTTAVVRLPRCLA
jgi:PAS domain S-box-containing protein